MSYFENFSQNLSSFQSIDLSNVAKNFTTQASQLQATVHAAATQLKGEAFIQEDIAQYEATLGADPELAGKSHGVLSEAAKSKLQYLRNADLASLANMHAEEKQALFSENEVLREIIATIDSSLLEELDMVDQMKREEREAAAAMWWFAQKDCKSLEAEVSALQAQLATQEQESASRLEDAQIKAMEQQNEQLLQHEALLTRMDELEADNRQLARELDAKSEALEAARTGVTSFEQGFFGTDTLSAHQQDEDARVGSKALGEQVKHLEQQLKTVRLQAKKKLAQEKSANDAKVSELQATVDKLMAECEAHELKGKEAAASLEEMRTRVRDAVQARDQLGSKVEELTQRMGTLTNIQTAPQQEVEKSLESIAYAQTTAPAISPHASRNVPIIHEVEKILKHKLDEIQASILAFDRAALSRSSLPAAKDKQRRKKNRQHKSLPQPEISATEDQKQELQRLMGAKQAVQQAVWALHSTSSATSSIATSNSAPAFIHQTPHPDVRDQKCVHPPAQADLTPNPDSAIVTKDICQEAKTGAGEGGSGKETVMETVGMESMAVVEQGEDADVVLGEEAAVVADVAARAEGEVGADVAVDVAGLRAALDARSEELAAALQFADEQAAEFEALVADLRGTNAMLDDQLATAANEAANAARARSELEQRVRLMDQENASLRAERDKQMADAEDNTLLLERKIRKLKQDLEQAQTEKDELTKALQKARSDTCTMQATGNSEMERRIASLEEEVHFKQERVKHYREKAKLLEESQKSRQQEASAEIAELEDQVHQLQERITQQQMDLEKQKAGERKAVSEATAAMESRMLESAQQANARARELQDRIAGLESDLKIVREKEDGETNSRVAVMQERVRSVEALLAATRAEKDKEKKSWREQLKVLGVELEKAKALGIDKNTTGDNHEDASSKAKHVLKDEAVIQLQSQVRSLESELLDKNADIANSRLRVMELESDLESAEALHRAETKQLQQNLAAAEKLADHLRTTLERVQASQPQKALEVKTVSTTLQKRLAKLEESNRAEITRYKEKVAKLQKELENNRMRVDESRSEAERALAEDRELVGSLEAELEAAYSNIGLKQKEMMELQNQIKSLKGELTAVGESHKLHISRMEKQVAQAYAQLKASNADKFKKIAEWEDRSRFWQEEVDKARRKAEEKDQKVNELMEHFTALEGDISKFRQIDSLATTASSELAALKHDLATALNRCHEQEGTILKLKAESSAHKEEMVECERTLKDTIQTEMKVVELQATVRSLQKQLAADGYNHGPSSPNLNLEVTELRATVAELQGLLAEADCALKEGAESTAKFEGKLMRMQEEMTLTCEENQKLKVDLAKQAEALGMMKSQLASALLPESAPEDRNSSPLPKHSRLSPVSNNVSPSSTSVDAGSRSRAAVGAGDRDNEAVETPFNVAVAGKVPQKTHASLLATTVGASRQLTDTTTQPEESWKDVRRGESVAEIDTRDTENDTSTPVLTEADFDGWDFED